MTDSTEADIVETLNKAWVADALEAGQIQSTVIAERMIRERHAALDEITKLRAERDAAARDMRERAVAVAEYEYHVCTQQSDQAKAAGLRSDMYRFNTALHTAAKIAERVRALPDTPTVIATQHEGDET